jgi:hypothetical protein
LLSAADKRIVEACGELFDNEGHTLLSAAAKASDIDKVAVFARFFPIEKPNVANATPLYVACVNSTSGNTNVATYLANRCPQRNQTKIRLFRLALHAGIATIPLCKTLLQSVLNQ